MQCNRIGPRETDQVRQDDDAIFLHFEMPKGGPPWRIDDYGEQGLLSLEEKELLEDRFDLKRELVEKLSIYIGNCLDSESEVNLTRVSRSKALARGAKNLNRMAKLARRMAADRSDCERAGAGLTAKFADVKDATRLLEKIRGDLADIAPVLNSLEGKIDELLNTPSGAGELVPDDKRKLTDMRRQHVVRNCCHIWQDAGNKISYTTGTHNPEAPQRSGPLIDFIQTVIGFVTSPSTEIPVETLRSDIDTFKKLPNPDDTLKEPPHRG